MSDLSSTVQNFVGYLLQIQTSFFQKILYNFIQISHAELNWSAGTGHIEKCYKRKWKYFGGFMGGVTEVFFQMERPPAV